MRLYALVLSVFLTCSAMSAHADPLAIELTPNAANPANPQMGDRMHFQSVIRNKGAVPLQNIFVWMDLLRLDPGHQAPMGLEDWSAQQALSRAQLAAGTSLQTDWPMRLIQSGHYRVMIEAVADDARTPVASAALDMVVRPKPVVESTRVLPVAFGTPALLALLLFWRWRRA